MKDLKEIFKLTGIDLNSYKERQMKRRLNSLISKRGFEGYQQYVEALKKILGCMRSLCPISP